MCSDRVTCGDLRASFFKRFILKVGWNWVEINAGPEVLHQVCLSHSSLLQAHSSKGNVHIYIKYCTVHPPSPRVCNNTAVYIAKAKQQSTLKMKYRRAGSVSRWQRSRTHWLIQSEGVRIVCLFFSGWGKQTLYEQRAYEQTRVRLPVLAVQPGLQWCFIWSLSGHQHNK